MNGLVIKAIATALILMVGTFLALYYSDKGINWDDTINIITLVGAAAILILSFGVAAKYINQMKTDKATGELADENWDGIGEYTNELPSGWAYAWLGTAIWAMWYMVSGYPVNAFSQIGQYNEEVLAYNAKFEEKHKSATSAELWDMGQSIFLVQCAPCHGETGDGLSGKAQDFSARFTKDQVLAVIKDGSDQLKYPMGAMPGGMAQGKDAEAIATYVAGGMKGEQPAAFGTCAGCHGADGKGNAGSSPDIAGYDEVLVKHVLEYGKKGILGGMPSFKGRLTPVQEKALAIYINEIDK